MATKKPATSPRRDAARIKSLATKYEQTLKRSQPGETERLRLADEIYKLAIASEDAELEIREHGPGGGKGGETVRHLSLRDPAAALLPMVRFCNIWLPIPLFICIGRGCRPVIVRPGRICFLIGCAINVCLFGPGAGRLRCIYLCFRFG